MYKLILPVLAVFAVGLLPAGEPGWNWPKTVTADFGELAVKFESRSFWTLYGVEFRGRKLGVEQYGSHYGNVFKFKNYGFVGSGHVENEAEKLLAMELVIDGVKVEVPAERLQARTLKLTRKSMVRGIEVDSIIEIDGRRIIEKTAINVRRDETLEYAYFGMYPWVPAFSDYAVLDVTGETGSFCDSKKFLVGRNVPAVAIYSRSLECGILTEINAEENLQPHREDYWDFPGRYRKHYSRVLSNRNLRAGEYAALKLTLTPFAAPADQWHDAAKKLMSMNH